MSALRRAPPARTMTRRSSRAAARPARSDTTGDRSSLERRRVDRPVRCGDRVPRRRDIERNRLKAPEFRDARYSLSPAPPTIVYTTGAVATSLLLSRRVTHAEPKQTPSARPPGRRTRRTTPRLLSVVGVDPAHHSRRTLDHCGHPSVGLPGRDDDGRRRTHRRPASTTPAPTSEIVANANHWSAYPIWGPSSSGGTLSRATRSGAIAESPSTTT